MFKYIPFLASRKNECNIYYMEKEEVAEIDANCGLVLSPSFPAQVRNIKTFKYRSRSISIQHHRNVLSCSILPQVPPGQWFWTFNPPKDSHMEIYLHYVRGPATEGECTQFFKCEF